jgi:hypothetical protein
MAGNSSVHASRSQLTSSGNPGDQQSIAMPSVQSGFIRRSKRLWAAWGLLTVLLNGLMVFVVLPKASPQIRGLYSENRYADGYDQLAANLAAGNGYRFYPDTAETLMREPGYPLLLAGTYTLFGYDFQIVKTLNVALAFGTAFVMILIARRISASRLLIFGAPILFLFHPETLIAESRGGVEVFFGFMLALFILTVYRAADSERWGGYALAGAALGATLLVRSTPLLFPLLLFGYLAFSKRKSANLLILTRNFSAMMLTMCLVISPWVIRNYLLTGKFVPTASVLGVAAQTGLYFSTHHEIGNVQVDYQAAMERNRLADQFGRPFRPGYYQYFYSPADELGFSQYLSRRVADEYKAFPLLFLRTLALNLVKFWCGGKTGQSVVMNAIIQFPFVALAIAAVVLCLRAGRARILAPLVLLCIYMVGVSIPILAQARYGAPLIPFMSLLAMIAFLAFKHRFRTHDYGLSEIVLL